MNSGAAFVWMDRHLDSTRTGPVYLSQEAVARAVAAALHLGVSLGHYDLGALCHSLQSHARAAVAENHAVPLMQSLKGASARDANRILGRTGQSFWQAESYDHRVRDEVEWQRIVRYIEDNPVKAGSVLCADDLPLVERTQTGKRRDESRRGRHECPRHKILALMGWYSAGGLGNSPYTDCKRTL